MKEIGTVISSLESPNSKEFWFVLNENKGVPVRKGQFIQLNTQDGILVARVEEIIKTNRYYQRAESVSEFERSGRPLVEQFPVDRWEYLIAQAHPLGVFANGKQRRVTFPPSPGNDVYPIDESLLHSVLGLDINSGLDIGKIEFHNVDAKLNMTRLFQKHLAILAMSGAGKSFLTSILIEELLNKERNKRPSIIVVDPHGEYGGFAADPKYATSTKVYGGREITIATNTLSAYQLSILMPKITAVQRRELNPVIRKLRGEKPVYNMQDLIEAVQNSDIKDVKTKSVLASWLHELEYTGLFSNRDYPSIKDLAYQGNLSIFDLSDIVDIKRKQIIVSYFAWKLFEARRQKKISPFVLFVEEAHQFCPEGEEHELALSRGILEQIAREGRKFNSCLVLISQRPAGLSTTALSQCVTPDTYVTMNPNEPMTIGELEKSWSKRHVLAADTQNSTLVSSQITNYLKLNPMNYGKKVFTLETGETGRKITATEDHPFWVKNRGWVNLNKLRVGDRVAVMPQLEPLRGPEKDYAIIDENDIKKIIPYTINKERLIKELKRLSLLPLSINNEKLTILTRILGHIFGDGTLHPPYKNPNGYYSLKITFSGKENDLIEIKKDIEKLGFKASQKIVTEWKTSYVEFQKYGKRQIKGRSTYFKTGLVGLWSLLRVLGAPVGDKTRGEVELPQWVIDAPKNIKREFLASFMGSEAQKIRMLSRSAEVINIPFSKTRDHEMNGETFCMQLSKLLKGFKIKVGIRKRPYTINKDGIKTVQFTVYIKRSRKNIINFCKNVGYRYCKDRETKSRLVLEYLQIVDKKLKEKSVLWKLINKSPKSLNNIIKKFKLSKGEIGSLLRTKSSKNLRLVYSAFPTFDDWVKEVAYNLSDGLVWESISNIEETMASDVRDITVLKYHTFFANGFLTHNCNTHIIMRVTNPYDLDHIKESSEGITGGVLDSIPGLKVGEAYIVGEAVNYPILINVRERKGKTLEKGMKLEDEISNFNSNKQIDDKDLETFM